MFRCEPIANSPEYGVVHYVLGDSAASPSYWVFWDLDTEAVQCNDPADPSATAGIVTCFSPWTEAALRADLASHLSSRGIDAAEQQALIDAIVRCVRSHGSAC